jgi:hypothetical protein
MSMKPTGRSVPFLLILIIGLAVATYFLGWKVPVAAVAVGALVTAAIYLHDHVSHDRKCPECSAAKSHLLASHPDWHAWIENRSHVANLDEQAIVAVFYKEPDRLTRPARYKLFTVEYGNATVTELDRTQFPQYCLKNYK